MTSPISSGRPKKPSLAKPVGLLVRRISGESMSPTYRAGQLVVFAAGRPLHVGDVVMFRHDGKEKIKRIARLESGKIYVLGDNPTASTDSREFGWLGTEHVLGSLVWPRRKTTVQ